MNDNFAWLDMDTETAARRLLGCEIVRELDGKQIRVRIVETEAYDQADEASHTFRGRTMRNDDMFKRAGHLYVYFTYGMHYCCNVVCGSEGEGAAVLIRAVEPLVGHQIIQAHRGVAGVNATNGPAKLCQALAIDRRLSGHDLSYSPIRLVRGLPLLDDVITSAPRVGISKAVHELRRFYITGNAYVSRR